MKQLGLLMALVMITVGLTAQQANLLVKKGNAQYRKGDLKEAEESYRKALSKDAGNNAANFNLGNALQKQNQGAEAEKAYDQVINSNAGNDLKSQAWYNKGLAALNQKKVDEAVNAFKQSLKMVPEDTDTRENLQKALQEQKKQQQQQQQNQQQKDQPKQKEQQKPKEQKPEQNKTKLSMKQAEQLLNQLRDREKQLQQQLQKQKSNTQQQEKDW